MRIICQLLQPEWRFEGKRESVHAFSYQHILSFAIFLHSYMVKCLSSTHSPAFCLEGILNENIFRSGEEKQIPPSQVKEVVQALNCKVIVGML